MTMKDSFVASLFDRRNLIKSAGLASLAIGVAGTATWAADPKASPTKTSSTLHSIWNTWKANTICAPQPGRD